MNKFLDKLNLDQRLILITGAAGYLGSAFARTLSDLGAQLILVDCDEKGLTELTNCLASDNIKVHPYAIKTNLENRQDRERLIKEVEKIGRLDGLINNAGYLGSSNLEGWAVPFREQSLNAWQSAMEVNTTSVFHLCQGLTPLLNDSEYGGNIVNISSIYGEFGPVPKLYSGTDMNNPAAYGASKAALLQLTRWLACTLAPKIRVNAISPGGIERGQPTDFIDRYSQQTLLERMATEDDICGALVFLLSDMSRYITGENIRVSGGWGIS